jgi:hypothetical protein
MYRAHHRGHFCRTLSDRSPAWSRWHRSLVVVVVAAGGAASGGVGAVGALTAAVAVAVAAAVGGLMAAVAAAVGAGAAHLAVRFFFHRLGHVCFFFLWVRSRCD